MVRYIRLKARAKINLALDVTGTRPNGYHDVRMVMQSVGIYDSVDITMTPTPGIEMDSNLKFLASGENNLAYRAAKLLMDEFHFQVGVRIYLYKYIPMSAGLAGGSTDAAAVLYGINRLFRLGLTNEELRERGAKLGADVPFCLMRGTVLAEGIGEILTPLPPCPSYPIVLAKPHVNVSTKMVYEVLDQTEVMNHPNVDGMIEAISAGDIRGVVANMGNVLEQVTIPAHPVIDDIKQHLCDHGAMGAMMSGSGPTVFGIFEDLPQATAAYNALRESHLAAQVYLTEMYQERQRMPKQ
jgi:4-diphosphocytidyl-2-C-methyl-D-erythritol kinase